MKIILLLAVTFLNSLAQGAPSSTTTVASLTSECRSCAEECRTYDIERDGGLCKCDTDCEVYGDCCGPLPNQRPESCEHTSPNTNLDGLQFTCQSIFLDSAINVMKYEAFWMVSRCSVDWIEEVGESGEAVLEGCISETRNLPPVTDIVTGVVYKNQHCALCNRVENVLPWQASIVCTDYLYQLLNTTPISELSVTIFQEQCQACSYQPPSSVQPPRACYPTTDTCSEVLIKGSDNECVNGSYNLQTETTLSADPQVYRNRACARCDGVDSTTCLVEKFRGTNVVPRQCKPVTVDSSSPTTPAITLSTEVPATTPFLPPELPSKVPASTEFPLLPPFIPTSIIIENNNKFILPVDPEPINQGIPFTITLSNLGGGRVSVQSEMVSVNVTVDCPEGQAAVGLECRKTVCPENFVSVDGRCFSPQAPVGRNADNQSTNETANGSFLNCPTELVPLNDTEFTQLNNNTVLVDGKEFEVLGYSEHGQPLICPDNFTTVNTTNNFFFYPVGFIELTYIGCSLSVIGSALVLITYGLFKELRSLPSKILMNLAFANLVTNLLILIGGPVSQAFPITQLCTAVAILLHFFFLAQFAWMSVMSFEVVRKFNRARKLIVDSKRETLRLFISYVTVGWGLPLLISTVSVIVNFTTTGLVLYGVLADGSLGSCWINHLESAVITFVAPLILSILFNLVMFIVVSAYIIIASRTQAKLKKEDGTPFFRLNVAIFCTTGLTWIFGFIAILAGGTWAWYLFIIFNSTQGFVIFIAFLFTKKTMRLYINCITCRGAEKTSESSTASTSQSSTATVRLQKQNTTLDNITTTAGGNS